MKKIILNLFFILFVLTMVSCEPKGTKDENPVDITEKKEFKAGDIVEYDGVIYEYFEREIVRDPLRNGVDYMFKEENNYKSYYEYYYYDMSDYKTSKEMNPIYFSDGLDVKDSYLVNNPTTAYYFRLCNTFLPVGDGFIIKGYTDDLPKDVLIPKLLFGNPVRQIGFKAFENAPMETFRIYDDYGDRVVHPYAFSNCKNLKSIWITEAYYLSMSINNCESLEEVGGFFKPFGDCVCYNLPNLVSFWGVSFDSFANRSPIFYLGQGGIRKSYFYKCPKLVELSSGITSSVLDYYTENNVIYTPRGVPIHLLNNYEVKLSRLGFTQEESGEFYQIYYTVLYNADTLEAYLPFLNDGLDKQGKIIIPENNNVFVEEEDGIYAYVTYKNEAYNARVLIQKK